MFSSIIGNEIMYVAQGSYSLGGIWCRNQLCPSLAWERVVKGLNVMCDKAKIMCNTEFHRKVSMTREVLNPR